MRRIYAKLLLASVLSLLSGGVIFAEGPRSTSPADGETIFASDTSPLTRIVINCPSQEPTDIAKVQASGGNATLTKGGVTLQTLSPSQARVTSTMTVINQITYDLTEGVYEPGEYKFSVPANTIVYEMKGSETNLDAFEITFTILDANSMTVTPKNGSIVSASDLREIVITYSDKVKLSVLNPNPLTLTQTQSNASKDIFSYNVSVKGQTITLTCTNINSPTTPLKTGSAAGNPTLTIPVGTYSIDGVPNTELSYSYDLSGFTAKTITATPPPGNDSYEIDELSEILLEFDVDMRTNTSVNLAYVKLEQNVDGQWKRPNGYSSDVYYALEWIDANHAKIYPRPVEGSYTNTLDELETGRYAFHFVANYMYTAGSLQNKDVYLHPYHIVGATEAAIKKQTPPANGAVRASDWEDLVFEFSQDMAPGDDGDLKLLIKNPEGTEVQSFYATDVLWDGDNKSARLHLNPAIVRGSEEVVYTVEMPRGFLKQQSGSHLPSPETNFTVTVGRNVEVQGNYPKYSISPDPKKITSQTGLGTFTFTYYGADAVELGKDLPVFKTNGTSTGGDVTVTVGKTIPDEFPTVTVKFKTGVSTPKTGTTYTLEVPRLAWTITRGDAVYSTEENLTYDLGGGTNVTSTTIKYNTFGGTYTISYADHTEPELTKSQAVEYFSTVTINPANQKNMQIGTEKATLKKASDSSVVAQYNHPTSVASVSSANYTASLSEDMFEEGQSYYWELPVNAIKYKGNLATYSMDKALRVYFTILREEAVPQLYDVYVVNTAGKPRVRLDHVDLVCETDGESYGFAMVRGTGEAPYIGDENGNKLTVTDDDGSVSNVYSLVSTTHKGNRVTFNVSPTIIEQGKYTIVIPERAMSIDGSDFNNRLVHPFEIKDNHAEWSIPVYEQISTADDVQGADDHPMKGFSKITLSFPEDIDIKLNTAKYPVQFHRVWEETSGSGTNQTTTEKEEIPESAVSLSLDDSGNVDINFTPSLTADGTYRLRIPQGAILMMGAFDEYVPVTSYKAYFRIQDSTTATVEPKIGSTVTELSKVTFTFTKAAEVLADTNPDAPAGLYDADMNELEGYKLSVSTEGNKGIISINPPLDVDGKYTILVPEGRFRCKANASAAEEAVTEYRISYTVVDPSDPTPSVEANSVVSRLDKVEYEFLKAVNVDLTDTARASVKDASGNVLSDYTVTLSMDKDYYSDRIIIAAIEPAITATGTYSLVLDANSAACYREWNGDTRNNEEYVLPFEVKNPTDSKITPASGTGKAMAELSKLTVTYANAKEVDRGAGAVTLFAADGVTPLEGHTATAEASDDSNIGTITIEPALTESGTYKIFVGAGTFVCKLSDEDEGLPSRERTLTYKVQNPTDITKVTPAAEAPNMDKLANVTFTFANDIVVTAAATPEVTVVDEKGNDVLSTDNITVSLRVDGNSARVQFVPAITRAGKLTVTVPNGTFSAKLSSDDKVVEVGEQVLSYTLVDPAVATISPLADSVLPMIETVSVKFDNAAKVDANATAVPKVLNEAGEEISGYNFTATAVKDNEYTLTVSPAVTASGKYSIVIPAGAFACKISADTDDSDARSNVEYVLPLEVKNPTTITAVAPAADSQELDNLEGISFTFADDIILTAASTPAVTVEDEDGNDVLTADEIEVTLSVEGNVAHVEFTPAITRAGNLTVTVPSGTFGAQLSAEGNVVAVGEQVLNYSIKDRSPMKFDVIEKDEDILVLSSITVVFHKAAYVEINEEVTEEITLTHDTSKAPAAMIARSGARAPENVKTYTVKAQKLASQDNAIELTIDPEIREAGESTIYIPEGKIIADGQRLPESSQVFAVKGDSTPTWVEMMYGDDADITVINMNGVVIMKNVPASELHNLEPGMYIINGKTVMIR